MALLIMGLWAAAVESVHTVLVTASVGAAAKMARGSSFSGPGFDLTFANDYGAGKTSHESHMDAGEILALTKIAGGFAIDVSFSGEQRTDLGRTAQACRISDFHSTLSENVRTITCQLPAPSLTDRSA